MPKNIAVCCDGTDNEVATDSTNVLRLYRMLERDHRQVAYYDAGVGTLADPAAISTYRKLLSRRLDAAIGLRVRENVIAAYSFLARTYEQGDFVYLFGFSRGAYAARAVAGMIHFLGLLRPELAHLAPLAWSIYADDASKPISVSAAFRWRESHQSLFRNNATHSDRMVGVWHTVSSFGWIWNQDVAVYRQ